MEQSYSLAESVPATAFHAEDSSARASGRLEVAAGHLQFHGDNQSYTLPFSGLNIVAGGASNRLLFFSHPSLPKWSFASTRKEMFSKLNALNHPALSAQLKILDRGRARGQFWSLALLLGFLLLVVGLIQVKDPVISWVADRIPRSWEQKVGDLIFTSMKSSHDIVNDQELTDRFRTLMLPLTKVLAEEGVAPQIFLSRDRKLNAFAMPGGYVVVNAGIVLAAETPEEILGVVAHEFAHVTERHVVRNLVSALGIYAVFDLLIGNVAGTIAAAGDLGPRLLQMGFSRGFEREADAKGWQFLLAARINPRGMIRMFERLKKESESTPLGELEGALTFLSTHPSTAERIMVLESKAAALGEVQFISFGDSLAGIQALLKDRGDLSSEQEQEK